MNEEIEKYLEGEMTLEEKTLFESELSENEALQEQLEAAEAARAALDIFQIEVIRQQLAENDKNSEGDPNNNNKGKWGLFAIVILIFILGGIYIMAPFKSATIDNLIAETVNTCLCKNLNDPEKDRGQGAPDSKKTDDHPESPQTQACEWIKSTNANDYQLAIGFIQKKVEEAKTAQDPRHEYSLTLLLAIAHYKLGEREKAVESFELASDTRYNCASQARNILARLQSAN